MNVNGWLLCREDGGDYRVEYVPVRVWLTEAGCRAYVASNPGQYRVYTVCGGEVSPDYESWETK